jgi:predicted MPP superfamily phosphohydrolase
MSQERINLVKQVFDKRQYDKTINTSFNQLTFAAGSTTGSTLPTVDQFFEFYNQLFFEIPKFGVTDSHEYLIKTSQDYIGLDTQNEEIQALIAEITDLRQEVLSLNQQIFDLQNTNTLNG